MAEPAIGRDEIVRGLKALGLRAGDAVLVHSSLSSLGTVQGGAAVVIQALLDTVSPSGTVLMPAFNWSEPYDPEQPSVVGAIAEAFRQWPGARHSFHPTHPVTALGSRADELVKDHLQSPSACGKETPFGRLIEIGGKILLLGVDHDRSTTLHTLEEYAQAPYLRDRTATYLDSTGTVQTVTLRHFPGPHRNFIGLDRLLQRQGAQVMGRIGRAVARLINAQQMRLVVSAALAADPALMLCDNPHCQDCVAQRRDVHLAALRDETFLLSALASSVGTYPEEIADKMNRAGIRDVVVDRMYGLPAWMLPAGRLDRARAIFAEESIAIGAAYCPPDSDSFADHVERVKALGAEAAIVPFPPDPDAFLQIARDRGLPVYFENVHLPSSVCLRLLQNLSAASVLAFNPANFAALGERPFLDIVNQGPARRVIGLLYLADGTFDGEPTLPGAGNAEVKEILSILRCRSYSGRVVLATGRGGPCFRDLVSAFWRLLAAI